MPRPPIARQHPLREEPGRQRRPGRPDHDLPDPIRTGRITRRELPDLAHALEPTDEKAVETDQLPRAPRLHVPLQPGPRPRGQQPQVVERRALEAGQALPPGPQAVPPQDPVDARRRDRPAAVAPPPELVTDLLRPHRRTPQCGRQHRVLQRRRTLPAPAQRARRPRGQGRIPVPHIPLLPPVEQRPADPRLPTDPGRRDPRRRRPLDDVPADLHYLPFEGHSSAPVVDDLAVTPEDAADMALLATRASTLEVQTHSEHRTVWPTQRRKH